MRRLALLFMTLAAASCLPPVRSRLDGLSIEPPRGWTRASRSALERIARQSARRFRRLSWLTRRQAPMAVFVAPPVPGVFWSNLTIHAVDGALTCDPVTLAAYRRRLMRSLQEMPSEIRKVGITWAGRRRILKGEWTYRFAGAAVYAVQVVYPAGPRTLVLTYRFPAASLGEIRASVDASVRSARASQATPANR